MKILRHRVSSLRSVNPRIGVALFLVGVFALGAVVLAAGSRDDDQTSPDTFEGSIMPEGVPAPDFRLRNQDGEIVSMRSLRGRPVVVTFLYTTCQDSCPIQAQTVRGALDELGHDVPAVAISVDPGADTEQSARRFLAEQNLTGRMTFALGRRNQLAPLWQAYGTTPQSVQQEHMARAVLVDARGYQRVGYPMQETSPDMIAHDLRVLESG
jgi:protein SCO1